ncbi:hypothetical protein ACAX43_00545 [Paraburkholderia sp. IW21]|uniref:hypothetical protein n=1 Tax=Paraburkholderia sp. IW21 TaxID=3242488 RepID=UPI00351FFDAB
MKRMNARRASQSGQAIVEFLVATTLVMSVLFLAIVMLGKFNDVRNKTLMGSRYVAWERTVWSDGDSAKNLSSDPASTEAWSASYGQTALSTNKMDDEMRREFLQRFASANGAPIKSTDRNKGSLPSAQQTMWEDHSGKSFLGSANDVSVTTVSSKDPATNLNQYTGSSFGSVQTASGGTYSATMALPTRTLETGTLAIAIAQDSDTLKRLWPGFTGLSFSDTNVLLTNTWLAEGSANSKALFAKAVPAANTNVVQPSLYNGLQKYAPEIGTTAKLEFGRIQQDVLPNDRLRP